MTASRFKFKISRRTAGLTITGLLMIGAIGYVGYTTTTPATIEPELPVTSTPPSSTGSAPEGSTGTNADAPVVTMPERPVEVSQIPFLTTETPQPDENAPETPQVSTPVASDDLPNPFRPFRVAEPPVVTAAATTPSAPSVVPTRPPVVNPGSGVLPIPTIPNTPAATSASTTSRIQNVAGGGLPPVAIRPGGTVPVRPPTIAGATPFPSTPAPSIPATTPATTTPTVVGQPTTTPSVPTAPIVVPPTTSAPTVAALPTTPVRPPVRVPVPTLTAPVVATLPSAPSEATEDETTATVNPDVPAVIAELETPEVPAEPTSTATTPTPAAPNPLETYVAAQGLTYNAVVLGPVNTGIFQTKSGYVVVSLGEKLPDSDIVLKDVSATTVTLTLGDQQKTLELDKR